MTSLSLAVLALLLPPLLVRGFARRPALASALDGIVLAVIVSLVALEVVPDAIAAGGAWALGGLLLGLFGPGAAERAGFTGGLVHRVGLAFGSIALLAHAALDGVALATARGPTEPLALAVLLHQLPVGAAAWASARSRFGGFAGWLTLGLLGAATVAGFAAGQTVLALSGRAAFGALSGLAGGTLLHVVTHEPLHGARPDATLPHGHAEPRQGALRPRLNAGGAGALLALLAIGVATGLRGSTDEHAGVARDLLEVAAHTGLPVLLTWLLGERSARPERLLVVALAAATLGWVPALALAIALAGAGVLRPANTAPAAPPTPAHLFAGLLAGALLKGLLPDFGGVAGSTVAALALVQLPLPGTVIALCAAALALRGMDPTAATVTLGLVAGLPGGLRAHARGPRRQVTRALVTGMLPPIAAGLAVHLAAGRGYVAAPPASPLLDWAGVAGLVLLLGRDLLVRGPRAWLPEPADVPAHDHHHDHPSPELP
jgi:hypothetical protein